MIEGAILIVLVGLVILGLLTYMNRREDKVHQWHISELRRQGERFQAQREHDENEGRKQFIEGLRARGNLSPAEQAYLEQRERELS